MSLTLEHGHITFIVYLLCFFSVFFFLSSFLPYIMRILFYRRLYAYETCEIEYISQAIFTAFRFTQYPHRTWLPSRLPLKGMPHVALRLRVSGSIGKKLICLRGLGQLKEYNTGGGLAHWLASRTTDQGVPRSRPCRVSACCGLEQATFTPC